MFSATVPRTIAALARRYQRDAVRVETASAEEQHQDIAYQACSVRPEIARMRLLICCAFMMIKGCYFLRHTGVSVLSCHTAC